MLDHFKLNLHYSATCTCTIKRALQCRFTFCLPEFVEQDTKDGQGTGSLHDRQAFVCDEGFALFVPIEALILEADFDEGQVNAGNTRTSEGVDDVEKQIRQDAPQVKSSSCVAGTSGKLAFKIHLKNAFDLLGSCKIPLRLLRF